MHYSCYYNVPSRYIVKIPLRISSDTKYIRLIDFKRVTFFLICYFAKQSHKMKLYCDFFLYTYDFTSQKCTIEKNLNVYNEHLADMVYGCQCKTR